MAGKEIKTYSNASQEAFYPVTSKLEYICANAPITRGITSAPSTLDECFKSFSGIKDLAVSLGFLGLSGSSFIYTLWSGATAPTSWPGFSGACGPHVLDVFFNDPSKECNGVFASTDLGKNWLGCLWGTPDAPFSCSCPDVGPLFHAYLKLRLNVATFWNTPKNTPVKRAEFLDAIKYGKKANITVAGDFKLKIGQVVYINVNGVSGFPYTSSGSKLNGYYYIIGVKHVITNGGGHETALSLTEIPPITNPMTAGSTFAADYP
jgi:hypothetical protein